METSAELLYLLKEFDKDDAFGFKDDLERSQCQQWLFFWHGSVLYLKPPKVSPANMYARDLQSQANLARFQDLETDVGLNIES